MKNNEIMLKIENVSKIYKLGEIGGTTLREELQRVWARIRKKEDPTKKVTAKNYNKGEAFKALDNVSFEVKKGERIGIIGHNGVGKSTLLKLISRITGPSKGTIYLNGRVASMLEVGTGFHPELTGRENVYMNGAILGMTKKEIDAKMEDIIDFSEVRQFIDTPVKRYSSGMYVKLAFSVAAHLDSEIMIMDEVLAVGDMAFQNKCLNKMKEVSEQDDRTILYVSHNMNTIRQLCNRVIVLDSGHIIYNGDVEEGINYYLGINQTSSNIVDLDKFPRNVKIKNRSVRMIKMVLDNDFAVFKQDSILSGFIEVSSLKEYKNVVINAYLSSSGVVTTSMMSNPEIILHENSISKIRFSIDLAKLAPVSFSLKLILSLRGERGEVEYLDVVDDCYNFRISQNEELFFGRKWNLKTHGFFVGSKIIISQQKNK